MTNSKVELSKLNYLPYARYDFLCTFRRHRIWDLAYLLFKSQFNKLRRIIEISFGIDGKQFDFS